ncbi:MAG: nucleotidyltransferase domain-containing protein [Flavobacteriales bacterium]|nr:nucleotidyltransferase domain-containing protein [Flavobacteriales bacterium]
MNHVLKGKTNKLKALCKKHHVLSLSLFGSAAGSYTHDNSDIDFLIRFKPSLSLLNYADNYFDLLESLTLLFNKKIDLVSEKALKNPILIEEINKTKIPVYEF